jgi:hypothetical protein
MDCRRPGFCVEVSSQPGRAAQIFELGVMRLEIVVADAPILNRHVRGEKICAVALRQVALERKVGGEKPPGFGVPMHAGAAGAVAEHEGAPRADRQRRFARLVSKCHRHLRVAQEQFTLQAVAQFVLHVGDGKVRAGVAPRTSLDSDDLKTSIRQFIGENGSGPA